MSESITETSAAQESVQRVIDEQAALRRVAALVAEGTDAEELFAVAAEEIARVLHVPSVRIGRFDPDAVVVLGEFNYHGFPAGSVWPHDAPGVAKVVFETGRPARVDDHTGLSGVAAETNRALGITSAVGAPIVVAGEPWGLIVLATTGPEPLPADSEERLVRFTELMATSIANAGAGADLRKLLDEQAALNRLARLVAEGADSSTVFTAVCEETGRVIGASSVNLAHYTPEGMNVTMAGWSLGGTHVTAGTRLPLAPDVVGFWIRQTSKPTRIDSYEDAASELAVLVREAGIRSSVAAPVLVDGRVWGALIASTVDDEPLAAGTERRLVHFTELVATAIANAEAREGLRRLTEEQEALRRRFTIASEQSRESLRELLDEQAALHKVARLVAEGADSPAVFDAVCAEAGRLMSASSVNLAHYTPDGFNVTMAGWSLRSTHVPVGTRLPLAPDTIGHQIQRSSAPARIDSYEDATSELAVLVRESGIRSSVAAPIIVDGQPWGALVAGTDGLDPLPGGTEERLARFSDLIATAIANAEARDGLHRLADEQAALRRVATLVARESAPVEIFGAVTEEACRVLASEAVGLLRFDPDETATLVAQSDTPWDPPPPGTRFTLDGENVVTQVLRTGQTVRVDDWTDSSGAVAAMASVLGVRSAVASPVVVEGRLWGTIIAATSQDEPLANTTESRLFQFTALVATAIANAGARGQLSRLAEEQAALRRVAVLVAQQPSPEEVFAAVTQAVGPLLGADLAAMHVFRGDGVATVVASWSQAGPELPIGTELPLDGDSAVARIFRTRAAARIDDYAGRGGETAEVARGLRLRTAVGAPILVEGKLWGALMAATRGEEPLPEDAEARIAAFTELVATAVSNAEAREELRGLADEQAALRRVATLVAEGAAPGTLFAAVADEVAAVLGVSSASVSRFLPDGASEVLASLNDPGFPVGSRWRPDEGTLNATILETSRPVRIDQSAMSGPIAEASRVSGVQSVVGVPIVVEGRVWGMVAVGRQDSGEPLPADTEVRLTDFTELIATAISNTEARDSERRLAEEQAALRRVAELVAREASPGEVFTAIADTISGLLGEELRMVRFDHDDETAVAVAASDGAHRDLWPVGLRIPLGGNNVLSRVFRTGEPARIDDYGEATGPIADVVRATGLRSAMATPIVLGGRRWGAMLMATFGEQSIPANTESRLGQFTELMATAISNAEAHTEVERLAEEQAALRRVATLVAEGAAPQQVFWAVIEEVRGVLGCDAASLLRYHEDYSRTELADTDFELVGERAPLGGHNAATLVYETGRPVRIDDYAHDATGPSSEHAHHSGWRACVAVPVNVEGRLWGVVMAASKTEKPLATDTEGRLAKFTELVATAISNTDARDGLRELANEQVALRRVATLVAASAAPSDVFAAVTEEIALVLGADATLLCRADPDGAAVVVGSWGDATPRPGTQIPQGGTNLTTIVLETGRPARIESYADATGDASEVARSHGLRTAVGAPILVEGRLWGLVIAGTTTDEPLPEKAEERLAGFTEIVATAISNAEARGSERRLSGEQEALRRVATLVARGVPPATLFSAVSKEIARVFGGAEPGLLASLIRFDPGPECVLVAASMPYEQEPVGSRWKPKELYVSTQVLRTGASARVDEADIDEAGGPDADVLRLRGFLFQVGTPIVVEDRVWGAMTLNSNEALPPDTDERLARFTELIATAIANAESRNAIARLADEQAALRRVATLVARDAPSTEVFEAVAMEVGKLLDTDITIVGRYNGDGTATAIGNWSASPGGVPVGTRSVIGGRNVLTMVAETGKPARMDAYDDASGEAADIARRHGWSSSIAAPINVEGRVWGVMLVANQREEPFPSDAEARLAAFTELIATAISNSEARDGELRLTDEQAALRRVATLVAEGVPPEEVFTAAAKEVQQVLGVSGVVFDRYDDVGASFTTLALVHDLDWVTAGEGLYVGAHFPVESGALSGLVYGTGAAARIDDYSDLQGVNGDAARRSEIGSSCGAPIIVEGRVWGVMCAFSRLGDVLPSGTERRLDNFARLVATAVANTAYRAALIESRARIVAAGDEARRRIERNLHDGTQQRLIALGLDIAALRASAPEGQRDLDANLERLEGEVDEVLGEVRELSRGLHPGLLSRQGLGPSLRALARRSTLPVSLEIDLKERPPEPVETATYFVVSEAMTNAVKHAQASYITVSIAADESHLRATIADDGVGGAEAGTGIGSGLIGLVDRVSALGGRFELESPPGRGTTIAIELPLTL